MERNHKKSKMKLMMKIRAVCAIIVIKGDREVKTFLCEENFEES